VGEFRAALVAGLGFCATKRSDEFLSNVGASAVTLHDLATNETVEISLTHLNNFLEIEAANYLEQNINKIKVLKQLRNSGISAAAKHDVDVRLQDLARKTRQIVA
jgi:hypothetical protein